MLVNPSVFYWHHKFCMWICTVVKEKVMGIKGAKGMVIIWQKCRLVITKQME